MLLVPTFLASPRSDRLQPTSLDQRQKARDSTELIEELHPFPRLCGCNILKRINGKQIKLNSNLKKNVYPT